MRNSAKNHDGQTSKALEFEFGLAVDSEEMFSMASKQVFSGTGNCKNSEI